MNKRQYVELARAAVSDLEERGVPLTDSVKSAAADMGLNNEQTRRLAEFTNTVAHLHLFDKQAEDKYIEFELVDPDAITAAPTSVCAEKVASEVDLQDFFLDLPNERRPQIKTASNGDEIAAYLKATSPVDPATQPYANGRSAKVAMRMQKIARELELQTMQEYERYLDGVRKLAFELERATEAEKRAFVSDVRGLYREGAEHILTTLDVVNHKLQVGEIKEASVFPFESALTRQFGELVDDRQRVLDTGAGYKRAISAVGV